MMFDYICEQHRYDEYDTYLVKYLEESRHKCVVYRIVDDGEADRNHDGRDDIGEEGVSGHLLQIATELLSNYCCGCSTWSDDTRKNSFHEDETVSLQVKAKDEAYDDEYENHLEYTYPEMPVYRLQLMEIHFAKRHEKNQEHEQRQNGIKDRCKECRRPIKCRNKSKDEVE